MGESQIEKDINKVFKMHGDELDELYEKNKNISKKLDSSINSSEKLLKSFNIKSNEKEFYKNDLKKQKPQQNLQQKDWKQILDEANEKIPQDVSITDILSKSEILYALDDLKRINTEFNNKTKLNKTDIAFLIIATALQTLRWVLAPTLGQKINKAERLKHNDKLITAEMKRQNKTFQEKYNDFGHRKSQKGYKSWEQIIFSSVPYDSSKNAHSFGVNMAGGYHRYKTLGHDPILGWVFGTANIITDTITLSDFSSYKIQNMAFSESIPTPFMFANAIDSVKEDNLRLIAGLFAQSVHLKSDKYTKVGLPVPVLGSLNPEFAKKLYIQYEYDLACLEKDLKIVSISASIAVLINFIIKVVHGFFYNESKDHSRKLYEVRTRKILIISNSIASSSNIIASTIIKNPNMLDIGGILVTISRLFMDIKFMSQIKNEYIQGKLDEGTQEELNKLDVLYNEICQQ